MPRKAIGGVIEPKQGRAWAIRFRAYGKRRYVALGTSDEGWTREKAEKKLGHVLADVERGIWKPEAPPPDQGPAIEPTFHEFASEWFEGVAPELRERTRIDYQWRLSNHLLPYFAKHRLSAITVEEVDRYRREKVRESKAVTAARQRQLAMPERDRKRLVRPLSNGSINKTIRLLAVVLEQAVEYGYLDRNPAKGRKRLLKEDKPTRSYLQPDQVAALLSAAGKIDADAREGDTRRRRPLLATLTLAGLRISEALDLRWRDVNLDARRLRVAAAKTDAGVREVDLTPALQELLADYRNRSPYTQPGDLVFPTGAGKRDNPSNVRNRFLDSAAKLANIDLRAAGREPMPDVTPHSLRRTFISLLLAAGADVPYVMAQAGHTDPKMTLGLYAQVIASKTDHGAALDGIIGLSARDRESAQRGELLSDANVVSI
ncbi:MAG TPA: site-specific integrase [Solirubrobacterales bacterium]|nr:site-specific integrase [Solirubrobacterales bacterium]